MSAVSHHAKYLLSILICSSQPPDKIDSVVSMNTILQIGKLRLSEVQITFQGHKIKSSKAGA